MGSSRTRTTFRFLLLITCASASSTFFWSTNYRGVVRDNAFHQNRKSSFQEVEQKLDGKRTPDKDADREEKIVVEDIANGAHSPGPPHTLSSSASALLESKESKPNTVEPEAVTTVTTPAAPGGTSGGTSGGILDADELTELQKAAKEVDAQEGADVMFNKAETALQILQERLTKIDGVSTKIKTTIEEHRGLIKTQRDEFVKFVKALNDDMADLKRGVGCINKGASMMMTGKLPLQVSFLETTAGDDCDPGTPTSAGSGGSKKPKDTPEDKPEDMTDEQLIDTACECKKYGLPPDPSAPQADGEPMDWIHDHCVKDDYSPVKLDNCNIAKIEAAYSNGHVGLVKKFGCKKVVKVGGVFQIQGPEIENCSNVHQLLFQG